MLFNSYSFLLFFGAILVLHYSPFPWRVKKFNLLWASYLFYAAWNPPFVLLLAFSTLVDWHVAKRIFNSPNLHARRVWLGVSLAANLGLLGFFKYGEFVLENTTVLLHQMGIEFQAAAPDILLPIGISFYTFQTLSYTLDIYFKKSKPWNSFLDYALYVTFFPQLVAGPIVRAVEFLPQCTKPKRANTAQFGWGLSLLALGLFQKTVLADSIFAKVADPVFASTLQLDTMAAWGGTLAFGGQIFCDFAGYSTCAIGIALCLGFTLPDNFRFPYAAVGFSDFWQRWHISLSSWLRDYLYIPLGGSRDGKARTVTNLIITMFLGGLWHGAAWTFVVWGLLHGLFLVIEHTLVRGFSHMAIWSSRFGQIVLTLTTFIAVTLAWVFFRAQNVPQALYILKSMFGLIQTDTPFTIQPDKLIAPFVVLAIILATHACLRHTTLEDVTKRVPWWGKSIVIAILFAAVFMREGENRAFIYFQF